MNRFQHIRIKRIFR